MLSSDKSFGALNRPQKSSRFVRVDGVLDIFAVRKQLKIVDPVIRAVQVFMVDLHSFWNWADKSLPHRTMNRDLSVLSIFAWAKPNVMVARYVRLNRPRAAIAGPRLAMLNVERGCGAGAKKVGYSTQRAPFGKHSFGGVNLIGAKQLASGHTSYARQIANFVKAFVATDRFPNLHAVDIKPAYVGGQV